MVSTTSAQKRYYSGEICPQTGTYAQYSDRTGDYAGTAYDRKVDKGERFPPSENNHHFRKK